MWSCEAASCGDRAPDAAVAEGLAPAPEALARKPVGPHQLQAVIAAVHEEAPTAEETGRPQVLALYGLLERAAPEPVVTLDHPAAAATGHGPRVGLGMVAALETEPAMARHHRLASVRTHLWERAGVPGRGARRLHRGRSARPRPPERRYLPARADRLG